MTCALFATQREALARTAVRYVERAAQTEALIAKRERDSIGGSEFPGQPGDAMGDTIW